MKIKIELSFWAMISLAIALDMIGSWALLMIAAAIHEAGHLICIIAFGGRIEQITAMMGGFDISYTGISSYKGDVFVALSGPFANFFTAMLVSLYFAGTGNCFAGINLMLCIFNLIPVQPLDGGRALCALFEWISPLAGEKTFTMFSASLSMVLFAISIGACFESMRAIWSAIMFGIILSRQQLGQIYKETI